MQAAITDPTEEPEPDLESRRDPDNNLSHRLQEESHPSVSVSEDVPLGSLGTDTKGQVPLATLALARVRRG